MNNGKFVSITEIPSLENITIRDAQKLFNAIKANGIIIGGYYDDNRWICSDERVTCTIDFNFNTNDYDNHFSFLGISADEMVHHLKAYALSSIGKLIIHTIQSIIREIKYVLQGKTNNYIDIDGHGQFSFMNHICEFFSLLPYNDSIDIEKFNCFQEQLNDAEESFELSNESGAQRKLASFDSYFKFHEILDRFWKTASSEQKIFSFPVYLWWKLSGVIPMRPMEFILTPRNCLNAINGETYIKIRHTRLKGPGGNVSYKIDSDYEIVSYSLSADLAETIRWYIEETNAYYANDLNTLFCANTHYSQWGRCVPYCSRYFTYANMSTCLRYFYTQIIEDEYKYTVIYDRKSSYLRENEINYLHLGDTRHLALINMIAQGATPVVTMMLAGHKDINITSHYYSNITQYIECKTYRQYKALQKGQEKYTLSVNKNLPPIKQFTLLDNHGRCYSSKYANGNYEDCENVAGPNGELGYCESCDYYFSDDIGLHDRRDRYQQKIQEECQLLSNIVNKVRHNRGEREDIIQVLLNLRSAEYSYQKYIEEKVEREMYHGTEEKN